MIYLNKEEIKARYGASFATGGATRFNAESCSKHQNDAYKYEFGYLNGYCVYAIIQKRSGGIVSTVERQSLLALNNKSEWKIIDGAEKGQKPISFQCTPPKEEVKFPSPLFGVHQHQRSQLVIFHPKWQVDLEKVAANPL
jgi:hypothetical protein